MILSGFELMMREKTLNISQAFHNFRTKSYIPALLTVLQFDISSVSYDDNRLTNAGHDSSIIEVDSQANNEVKCKQIILATEILLAIPQLLSANNPIGRQNQETHV